MQKYLWLAFVLMVVLVVVLLLERLRRETTKTLDKILYVDQKPQLYLELLKNKRLQWIFTKQTIQQLELNAYLLLDDHKKINDYFDLLSYSPMNKGQKLELNTKKLSYYCLNQNKQKALEAKEVIQELLAKSKDKKNIELLNESHLIYDIYINHDITLIKSLDEQSKHQQGVMKGITLFRCAKLSVYAQNNQQALDYLNQAQPLLKNTEYEEKITKALSNVSLLKKY